MAEADMQNLEVTTVPVGNGRKVYVAVEKYPELRIPMREIPLSEESGEEPVRVYDPSGPYTDPEADIDISKGLPEVRRQWVLGRNDVEVYQGREEA